ncbi:MAG: hypothetical protein H7144_03835 [Burkholderiales bacterium]|nr:hypothetical protein [Phycisphaerae bacterium]
MIFSILILLIVAGITYFHFLQGGFTSAISAGCAALATLVAFGYYEQIVVSLQPGAMVDQAQAMVLIGLYGVTYIILRVIFDAVVPGNIRLPLWVDRGCAVAFGLIAALMAGGVFAVGGQLLPFGPSAAFARYELREREVTLPRAAAGSAARSDLDSQIRSELVPDTLEPAKRSSMLLPADDLVLSLVSTASEGAFQGNIKFTEMHPDLGTEAFANRVGADSGVRRVVINGAKDAQVAIPDSGLSIINPFPTLIDSEIRELRPDSKSLTFPKDNSKKLLAIRALFRDTAADTDGYVRIPPAAARLVIEGKTFYPIGTMESTGQVALARLDDFVVIAKDDKRGADFVYAVDSAILDRVSIGGKFKAGAAFVEFKLLGRIRLDGMTVNNSWSASDKTGVMRKKGSPLITPPGAKTEK